MKTITIKLSDYKPYPTNPNTHDDYQIGELAKSLDQFEQVKNIVVWKGHVIAGHGLRQAAMASGITELEAVDVSDWPREKAEKFMIADNRLPELAVIDPEIMGLVLAGFDEIDIPGVDDTWLEDFGIGEQEELIDPGPQIDRADELREKWGVELGQLWQLGDHRLICGDCTDRGVVERVMEGKTAVIMITDPPYSVNYIAKAKDMNRRGYGHSRAKSGAAIEGDQLTEDECVEIWRGAFEIAPLGKSAAWYIWHAPGRPSRRIYNLMIELDILHHCTIIWKKNNFVIGRGEYQWIHEPCLYGWKKGNRPPFYGERNQTTMWEVDKTHNPVHPTQKPTELFVIPILNHTKKGELCYDPFLGSGTLLVAAEETGRVGRGVEINPKHTAVTLERWHEATGKMPELID